MRGIKIGNCPKLEGRPGIDDLTAADSAKRADTFRVRGKVNRLGKCVVEVELNAMAHPMPQCDLQRIVVRRPDGTPCVKGCVLRSEERKWARCRIVVLARWVAWVVETSCCGVADVLDSVCIQELEWGCLVKFAAAESIECGQDWIHC